MGVRKQLRVIDTLKITTLLALATIQTQDVMIEREDRKMVMWEKVKVSGRTGVRE